MPVLTKKLKLALLGVGFLILAAIAVFVFDDIEMWFRGRTKLEARAKVEQLLTEVMEKTLLPPVQKILSTSEFCRASGSCSLTSAWDYFDPDPKNNTFARTANRTLILPREDSPERLDLRFQAGLDTVNAREFMERPTLDQRRTTLSAIIQLYGPEATIKTGRSDPALQKLAFGIAAAFVGQTAIDYEKQVLEPCLKRRPVRIKFGEINEGEIRCTIREQPERMEDYLKRRRGEVPAKALWYMELDLSRRYLEWSKNFGPGKNYVPGKTISRPKPSD